MTATSVAATPPTLQPHDLLGFDEHEVRIQLGARRCRLNRFWLRDNCPANGDRASLFRPFSVASMTDDLTIVGAAILDGTLQVAFDDGCEGRFDAALLASSIPASADAQWCAWGAGHAPAEIAFRLDIDGGREHHRLLRAVERDGFALVTGIPDDPQATETLASWLGPIRTTDFGRVFDIVTQPSPFTPSQSEEALDPHTDDPYRYHPPGISILHCVSPCDGDGGVSTITDGFAVAQSIAADDPEAFALLTSVDIPYVHRRTESVDQGAAVDLRAAAPVVSLDREANICGIRFHERSMATLRLDPDIVDPLYRALMQFGRRVLSAEFRYERRLAAGEAIVYDNQRVLHGRTAITGANARRHLRLCTVDRDQVHSRLRRLCSEFDPAHAGRPMTAGSAS